MTTIATDGRTMAGDGRGHCRGTVITDDDRKVTRLPDGRIVGCCGSHSDASVFIDWLENGGEHPKLDEDFGALVLMKTGAVEWYSGRPRPMTPQLPTAIGSGMDMAIGAMIAGRFPGEAVAIAAQRDIYTGGRITVEAIEQSDKARTSREG